MVEITKYLKQVLSETEIQLLNEYNSISGSDSRLLALRSFFHKQEIFDLVSKKIDPTRLASDIHINCKGYGF